MLRECDNSTLSSDSGNDWHSTELMFGGAALLPPFRAQFVQQTGSHAPCSTLGGSTGSASQAIQEVLPATAGTAGRISAGQWRFLEAGLRQRFEAISACMDVLIRKQNLPEFLKVSPFLTARIESMLGPVGVPQNVATWTWFGSTDLHLTSDGELTVLDHNFSCATGLDTLAHLIHATGTDDLQVAAQLSRVLFRGGSCCRELCDPGFSNVVVLDPGFYSATFHANEFLARCLNAHIARSSDLCVTTDGVFLHAGHEQLRISTVVRRMDDDLLDPNCFRPDSLVGLPGLVRAWTKGLVNVVSPPGACIANDRSFGILIPHMIREFLGQSPLLRSAAVLECGDPAVRKKVLSSIEQFAIRTNDPQHPARAYFGNTGSKVEFAELLNRLHRNPSAFVARPLLPSRERAGLNLRVYAGFDAGFRLLRAALVRPCQPDGGAPPALETGSAVSAML